MRLPLTIIAVAINIIVFTTLATFLMTQISEQKIPMLSTFFFALMGLGLILNTIYLRSEINKKTRGGYKQ